MINIVLLTGFLGAGKTTLMTSLLEAYKDKKIGVIVNEFGKVNIDAQLIRRDGLAVAELSNGSIFCACLKANFVESLIDMSGRNIEYLFIEASGLADPANMSQLLEAVSSKTIRPYSYKGSICVIDAENFLGLYELLPAVQSQVEYSSAAIVNKTDLVDEAELTAVLGKVHEINPGIEVYTASYCRVDFIRLVDGLADSCREFRDTTNTMETRPKTLVLTGDTVLSYKELKGFLQEIATYTYRIKGFAQTDRGPVEISAAGINVSLSAWKEELKGAEIVVISSVGIKLVSEIANAIDKYLKGKIRL